jgi:orotate phosphoribosyltransferase
VIDTTGVLKGLPEYRELVDLGAVLQGHFQLSSGLRSPVYVQVERLFEDPHRADRLVKRLFPKLAGVIHRGVDIVAAPAIGGIRFGYELARQLGAKAVYLERQDGAMTLRRGFRIEPGDRVLVAEDVVTTGGTVRELIKAVRDGGGVVVGCACVVDRSAGRVDAEMLGLPLSDLAALVTLDIPVYDPDDVPEWMGRIPATKPGSRTTHAERA